MNDLNAQNFLELEVKNFGPIAEAKIDLRPFTVFVGPSNTGKSYLAILIYALHQLFSGGARLNYAPHAFVDRMIWDKQLSQKDWDSLSEWLNSVFENISEPPYEGNILLSGPAEDLIRSAFSRFDARGDVLGNGISRCFGVDGTRGLIRKNSQGGAQVALKRRILEDSDPFLQKLKIGARKTVLKTTIPEKTPAQLHFSHIDSSFSDLLRPKSGTRSESELMAANTFIGTLAGSIFPSLVAPLHLPAYYLPADRTGIMHSHMAVTSALIRNAPMAGLRQDTSPPLFSGVLADFLEQLINLGGQTQQSHRPHRTNVLGDQIEKSVLDGTVHIKRSETGYPRFTYRPEEWNDDLPLMNASSMVSELAPVVLYLRHLVEPDNVLIIEEPESHLHPAKQVEFTRQLAALVRAGVRVIITTHSEWVLEELANIVRLSELSKTKRKGIEGGDVALRPEQVGAWLFQPKNRPKGSVVKEIPLDDSGLFPSGFDEVAVALHNNWAEISSRDRGGANG